MVRTTRQFKQKTVGSIVSHALACALLVSGVWTSNVVAATERSGDEVFLTCRIEGRDREASVSLSDISATYRYGPSSSEPELTLTSPLADLDYVRHNGPAGTVDEIMTFANGDTT